MKWMSLGRDLRLVLEEICDWPCFDQAKGKRGQWDNGSCFMTRITSNNDVGMRKRSAGIFLSL
jgi:hypothetical protein